MEIVSKDSQQQFLLSLYLDAPLSIKKWSPFSLHLNIDWPHDLLWPTDCKRSEAVQIPFLDLKSYDTSASVPMERSYHPIWKSRIFC